MEFGNLRSYIRLTFIEYVTDVLPVPTAHLPVCQDTVTAKYSSDLNFGAFEKLPYLARLD